MKEAKFVVSPVQLFAVIILFDLGSAIVMNVGSSAKQNAWIAIAAATVIGLGLFGFYRILQARQPSYDLFELVRLSFGRWLGSFIIAMYVVYFLYVAARVMRDFLELLSSAVLENTPTEVLAFSFSMVIAYMIWLGFGVIIRTAEFFFPIIMGIILVLFLLILIDRDYQFFYLKPVLGDGLMPVWSAIFPTLVTFPFGELIVCLVFMQYLAPASRAGKVSSFAIGISGLILAGTAVLETISLGVKMKERTNFPFLVTVRDVSFGYFFERMEMAVVFVMLITILVKVSLFLFGALKGIEHLFRVPYRTAAFPVACLAAIFSIKIADTFAEHTLEGLSFVPMFIHIPMQLIIPLALFIILVVKRARHR
ncbi:spore germination protein [Paenibacillus oenotherae]|uniref:Spore germination protein n=1 Tax=Paenibacillus oenotherae TaxID=1435645 RepID=A0ABS7D9A9_9BACL|nr:endospore germination permease [Paenibacillus oenotherae]MBW7475763.1 spore germination protein [Paenibacillus oenotherae]